MSSVSALKTQDQLPSHRTYLCACRPLIVIGKGAAQSQADTQLRKLVEATGIPFLATAMGRGVVPDNHPQNVNAARSLALAKADVALIVGARWAGGAPLQGVLSAILPPKLPV